MQHLDLRASPRSDVGKLKSDIAATDKGDAAREGFQIQKLRAGGQVFLPWYPQGGMVRTSRNHHMATDQGFFTHLKARPIHEVRAPVPRDDPCLGVEY